MKTINSILILILVQTSLLSVAGEANAMGKKRGDGLDPQVVSSVDLNRYAGIWYEVAHTPNFFQRKCKRSTAEYAVLDDRSISVHNTCYKFNGKVSNITGRATILNPAVPAKLRVVFNVFTNPKGDYWITELDTDYRWAVVSGPGKGFNFILSREAPMRADLQNEILNTLKSKGFNTDEFIFDQYE